MDHAAIERFKALDQAFHNRADRGDRLYTRFAALAALSAPQDIETLIERTFETRSRLNEGLVNWRAPGKPMRLVFAAALVASERAANAFLDARNALATRRAARGGRALSHGGSCAALALVASGGDADLADNFFDLLEALAAPWWRRMPGREEVLAASFAALGETPDEAASHLSTSRDALLAAGVPTQNADAAAYEVALLNPEHGALASAWTTLNLAVRGRAALSSGIGKTGLAILASQGNGQLTADALVRSFDAVRAIAPKANGQTAARLSMRLTQAQTGFDRPVSAANELTHILASQAAMVAAVTATTTAAVMTATN